MGFDWRYYKGGAPEGEGDGDRERQREREGDRVREKEEVVIAEDRETAVLDGELMNKHK